MKQLAPGDDCGFIGTMSTGLIGEQSEVLINGGIIGRFLHANMVHDDIDLKHLETHTVVVRVLLTVESVDGVKVQPKKPTWFEEHYGWLYEEQEPEPEPDSLVDKLVRALKGNT